VLSVCILVTLATGGALLQNSMACFQQLFTATYAAAVGLSEVLVFVFYIPTAIVFAFKNTWSCVQCLYESISHASELQRDFKTNHWDTMTRSQCFGFAFGLVIATVLFLLHAIGGGAVAGEGVDNPSDRFEAIFKGVTRFFNRIFGLSILTVPLAVGLNVVAEFGTDGPYVYGLQSIDGSGDSHDHAPVAHICEEGAGWIGDKLSEAASCCSPAAGA